MEARELRIGNIVEVVYSNTYDGLEYCENIRVTAEDIAQIYAVPDRSNYRPITLTPEILSKIEYLPNPIRIIGSHRVGIEIFNNRLPLGYEYLHQLQNLVFALTGEELKINL